MTDKHLPSIEEWREDFDDLITPFSTLRLDKYPDGSADIKTDLVDVIKGFIESLLAAKDEEYVEELKEFKGSIDTALVKQTVDAEERMIDEYDDLLAKHSKKEGDTTKGEEI